MNQDDVFIGIIFIIWLGCVILMFVKFWKKEE